MTAARPLPSTSAAPALDLADLTALVRAVAADPSIWEPKLQLPHGTERWWTRLSSDSRVDVWLLSWLPGHTTDLHDHGDSAAAFTVVRGRLAESRVDRYGRRTSIVRKPGPVAWLAPGILHDVRGAGIEPAVSIHAYSRPLTRMNYYAADDRGRLRIVRSVETHEPEEELQR
jgi:predicted metal-dependent enzyme (double-stranded beta helix superfamily)